MSVACFDTLVGLSKQEYSCFTDDAPEGFDTSDSGYHLTDTDYGLTIIDQCAFDGWELLQAARTQAILEIKSDLRAALREKYDGSISPFSGVIAQLTSTGSRLVTHDFLGLRVRTKNQKGAKLVLKKIFLALDTPGTYTVTIKSNDPLFVSPDPVEVVLVSANTMTQKVLTTQIELPLYSRTCEEKWLEYYIAFDRNGATPRNNNVTCCGKHPGWMDHLYVSGFQASDNEATYGTFSSAGFGMALDAFLICEELEWVCELEELNGYHLRDVLARSLQFRGAAIAISKLIDTILVNPCTSYQIESLASRRTYLNSRYSDNIRWVAQNLPKKGLTDCFMCKPENRFSRSLSIV
jgi:hypothetical protein